MNCEKTSACGRGAEPGPGEVDPAAGEGAGEDPEVGVVEPRLGKPGGREGKPIELYTSGAATLNRSIPCWICIIACSASGLDINCCTLGFCICCSSWGIMEPI